MRGSGAGGYPIVNPLRIVEPEFSGVAQTLTRCEYNLDACTQVHPALVAGEDTAVIIIGGDSISASSVNSSYTVTQTKNHMLCIVNGGMYDTRGTMLGCNTSPAGGSCYAPRLADKIRTAGTKARVILINIAKGGTVMARYASGGDCNHFIGVAAAWCSRLGLTPTHICWEQGPNDNTAGTSQASMEASLNSIRSTFTNAGITAPMYVAQRSKIGGSTSATVRAAQAAVVNGTTIKAGPDNDGVSMYDGCHSDATGADSAASNWKTSLGL